MGTKIAYGQRKGQPKKALFVANPNPQFEQHRSQTVSLHIKLDFTNDKAKVVPVGSNLQRLRHVFKKHGPGG